MKFLIVDDHALVRHGLLALLREHLPEVVFSEAASSREGLAAVMAEDFDLVIVDISMPGRSGLELIEDIRHAKPDIPLLVVSAHAERDYAVRALKLGAAGYVPKQEAPDILIGAVRKILDGGRYISPSLAELLAGTLAGGSGECSHDSLSNRELQVLKLIASGKSLKEIGADLDLSEKTVATYRARISGKMGLSSNVDLTRYAMRHGLVE
jgi:DNA-binding NarL/FixJ family response regulator